MTDHGVSDGMASPREVRRTNWMSLKVIAAVVLLGAFLHLYDGAEIKKSGEDSVQKTVDDTPGITKRGPSCAVSEYDEALSTGVEKLSFREMYDLIKYNGSEFVLVDVRTPAEYAQGFIPTAFLVTVDNGKFEPHVDFRQIMCGRNYVVLYCRSGRRASQAADTLKSIIPVKIYPGSWLEWIKMNPGIYIQ